jgi:hypothetical protein
MVYAFLLETFYQTHNMHWFKVRIKYGILKRTLTGKKNITAASNYNKKKLIKLLLTFRLWMNNERKYVTIKPHTSYL